MRPRTTDTLCTERVCGGCVAPSKVAMTAQHSAYGFQSYVEHAASQSYLYAASKIHTHQSVSSSANMVTMN